MSARPDFLVVGAGYAGSVVAREAAEGGKTVHVIDKRPHIAGNAYDEPDAHGVRVHRYGPHIFHTNAERIFQWLSRFTQWRAYEHRVLSVVGGRQYPFPINRTTLNQLYGLELDEAGAAAHFARVREPREPPLAAYKNRVFAIGAASNGTYGGMRSLMALRHVLELGCGALVIPEQVAVREAANAFDDNDGLKDERTAGLLKAVVNRLVEMARGFA